MIFSDYQAVIHKSRYAKWLESFARRETFKETVSRYFDFFEQYLKENHSYDIAEVRPRLEKAVLNLDVMPSMRALMTAGKALSQNHISAYNCAYVEASTLETFSEILYVLMHGTGVGFSVERQFVNSLPAVPEEIEHDDSIVVRISDSKEGWQLGAKRYLAYLFDGIIPEVDFSAIRPAGERLKTFGGRASGPEPFKELLDFCRIKLMNARGRKLTSLECHDIICKIGEIVVVGGVRRSALISLSNLSDMRMRDAKSGQWWEANGQRGLANNSVCYTERPDVGIFMKEWLALYNSKSGERGIFNRAASQRQTAKYRQRDPKINYGTNPCSEIILRSGQFCNLTEVVLRADDTIETVREKVEIATILGTMQACLTDIRNLSDKWKRNTEEERLLGVSMTGIYDNMFFGGQKDRQELKLALEDLRQVACRTNDYWANNFGIPESAAITCVKPSGTVSQLVDASSGIHPRHSEYYVRTIRGDRKDPLTQYLIEEGIPHEDCVSQPDTTVVFSFPIKSPDGALCRKDLTAIDHLELWKIYQENWCEHKPSVTISVQEKEWFEVGAWCWENFDMLSGVSFLPMSDHTYRQAPYQDIDEKTYKELMQSFPKSIDWKNLEKFEREDNTKSSKTLSCTAGNCEIQKI